MVASVGELMSTATARTGLDDFGDDSFREGLEILVRALGDEARLNARGEGFVYHRIGLHLAQRLQVEDWYRRHPEIDDEPVTAPLFGLGLPRTGSTALSFLLARDPDVRYLRSWEAAQPCPPPSTVSGDDPPHPA
jgi:Sulfotransferase family